MCVRGTEALDPLITVPSNGPQEVLTYQLNPMSTSFSRLASIAAIFEKFRWKKLRLRYLPNCPTTFVGSVLGYLEYDAVDAAASTVKEILNSRSRCYGALYEANELVFSPEGDTQRWYYTSTNATGDAATRQENPATAHIYCDGIAGAGGGSIGQWVVEYECEFCDLRPFTPSSLAAHLGDLSITAAAGDYYGVIDSVANPLSFELTRGEISSSDDLVPKLYTGWKIPQGDFTLTVYCSAVTSNVGHLKFTLVPCIPGSNTVLLDIVPVSDAIALSYFSASYSAPVGGARIVVTCTTTGSPASVTFTIRDVRCVLGSRLIPFRRDGRSGAVCRSFSLPSQAAEAKAALADSTAYGAVVYSSPAVAVSQVDRELVSDYHCVQMPLQQLPSPFPARSSHFAPVGVRAPAGDVKSSR